MQEQNETQEPSIFLNKDIALNEVEAGDFIYTKGAKPSPEAIAELRRQKQQRRAEQLQEPEEYKTFLSEDLKALSKLRGEKRKEFITQTTERFIYFLQHSNRAGFSKETLNALFENSTPDRTRTQIVKELIDFLIFSGKIKESEALITSQSYRSRSPTSLYSRSKGAITQTPLSIIKEETKYEKQIFLLC